MTYTKDNLRQIFQQPFNMSEWKQMLQHYFQAKDLRVEPERIKSTPDDEKGFYLGTLTPTDGYRIGLFYYQIQHGNVARKRVGLRNLVHQFIHHTTGEFDAALVVFDSGTVWRLSFVCDIKGENTAAKRFTYVFGENDNYYNTPVGRFDALQRNGISFENIKDAFSVERLNKDFFNGYKERYVKFLKHINDDTKESRDYVKKLLGRLVFLQFLQKKGWMGVPANQQGWNGGDKFYLNHLIERYEGNDRLLSDVLEPLFFNTLNERRKNDLVDSRLGENIKIPYLNGGLFDKDELDKKDIDFPYNYFKELMDFFAIYNFTIDENDPEDSEIGIDPEMLGHIFENLLEDNKDKGAFYTPKEIVQYMSEESIVQYLKAHTDATQHIAIDELIKGKKVNESIQGKATSTAIYKLLSEVKVCDPAIGSGAFPMGVLNVLYHARLLLYGFTKPTQDFSPAEVKREIIQNNIYGVDIEKGAVDIARLRFWLALVVDEIQPEPLPNLDFKIMQGNSLLEQFEGLDLSNLLPKKNDDGMLIIFDEEAQLQAILHEHQLRYFSATNHEEKQMLRKKIVEVVKRLIIERTQGNASIPDKLKALDLSSNDQFFLWHTWFADVFNRPNDCNGFDIVIGNPPYLESRSPKFSESLKVRLQSEIQKRRLSDSRAFPRGADLLIFFYELSLRLLNKKGYNVFITENSWLSTDYGKLFQNFLLKRCEIHAIIDSEYKYFETADINTIITIIRNRNEHNGSLPVKFFHCNGSLEKYPCNTFAINDTENISLKSFSSSDPLLQNYKWGVIIRAEKKLLGIIETISKFEDKSLSSKITIGQGLNLTKSHIVRSQSSRTHPYYTSEIGATYCWNNSSCYVSKDDISNGRKRPLLIMPRGIGTHFCSINECSGYTSSYVEVYGDLSYEETLNIWLFCNSSLFWLLREITGRTNLGGGMLKAEATDLKSIPICFNFNKATEISSLYKTVQDKTIDTNISQTLCNPQHNMIDAIVFKFFGIENEASYIKTMLLKMVNGRKKKSKTK